MSLLRKYGTLAAGVTFLMAAGAQPAHAALVTFTTTGSFGSTGTATLTEGDQTLTFVGVTDLTVDASDPGSSASFGSFFVTSSGNQSTGGLGSETFELTIIQVAPPGTAQFPATLSGQINFIQSNAVLTFTSPFTREIDGVFYTVTTPVLNLPAPSDSPNSIAVGGHVITEANGNGNGNGNGDVPEPASMLLFGLAAVVAGHRLRHRL